MDDDVSLIFQTLGHETTRKVGGCVRNQLLGLPMGDIDFATTLTPDQVIKHLQQAGIQAQDRYAHYGTVIARLKKTNYEITTLRRDHATDGRYADVRFTTSWEADAQRRDFTINALYQDAGGTIHDPLGGMLDIQRGLIQFIGDPCERITEDHLRILRYMRMSAWYQNPAEPLSQAAIAACTQKRHCLGTLSSERVMNETMKLLAAPHFPMILAVMKQGNITAPHLPPFADGDLCHRFIQVRDLTTDPAMAALVILCQNPNIILQTWPLTRVQRRTLQNAWGGEDWDHEAALLARALNHSDNETDVRALFHQWQDRRTPPLTAADLLNAGVPQGPELSRLLRLAQSLWQRDAGMTRGELLGRVLQTIPIP